MRQHGLCDRLHVVGRGVVASLGERPRLRHPQHGDAGARAAAQVETLVCPRLPQESDEAELRQAAQSELAHLREAARFATPERAVQVLEALFFAADKPLDMPTLLEATQLSEELLQTAIGELQKIYAAGSGGVALVDLGGRWQLRTEAQVGAYVRRMLAVKPMRLTRAALEALAIVAYRQPITRPEIEDLRGVDSGAVTKALLERKLIRILGKKDEPGRPLIFGTTKEFLELFNLRDLTQLPTLREFQELSEESRKIVEDEAPRPVAAGLADLAQDPAAGVVTRDPLDRREHTRRVLLARLAVRPLAAREPLLDLRARQAGPRADVDLAQARVCDDGHAVRRGDDLRGLVRALEVARVDRVERDEAQLFGQLAGLRASGVVQRRIGPALPDPVAVPVGLSVPRASRNVVVTTALR